MLSVRGSRELQAAVLAVSQARRDIRNDLNRSTRALLSEPWKAEVAKHARTDLDRKVIVKGARILAGNPPVAIAAASTRKLAGGLVPTQDWPAVEFGASRNKTTTYPSRSPKGRAFTVHDRHTTRQLPPRIKGGRVAFAALEAIGPRLASLWVQQVVRTFAEGYERGGSR